MTLSIDEALRQAVEAHQSGQVKEAERLYRSILEQEPKHADANHNLGVLAVGVGKPKLSLPQFKIALESNPKQVQYWLSMVDTLITVGQLDDARTVLEQGREVGLKGEKVDELAKRLEVKEEPQVSSESSDNPDKKDIDALMALYQQGRLEDVVEQASRLVAAFPKASVLYNLLGAAHSGLQRYDAAIVSFESALELNPGKGEAYLNLGNVLRNNGNLEEAITRYDQAIKHKPNLIDAYVSLGTIYRNLDKIEESIEIYQRAIEVSPDSEIIHFNFANLYYGTSQYEQALEHYNICIDNNPSFAEALNNRGNIYKDTGELDKAIIDYESAVKSKPQFADPLINLGSVLEMKEEFWKALSPLKRAIELLPESAISHFNLANVYAKVKELNEASKHYNLAIELKPDLAEAYSNLGIVQKELGDKPSSLSSFERAIELKPDLAEAYSNLGLYHKDMGALNKSILYYKKAFSIEPDKKGFLVNFYYASLSLEFESYSQEWADTFMMFLNSGSLTNPISLSQPILRLLDHHPKLNEAFENYSTEAIEKNFRVICRELSKIPLFLRIIELCPVRDIRIENLLKELRYHLLVNNEVVSEELIPIKFQCSLAMHCFTNEYIYGETVDESMTITCLEKKIEKLLKDNKKIGSSSIACLASYRPLDEYSWSRMIDIPEQLEALIKTQVIEPDQEKEILPQIPCLEAIEKGVSPIVRNQYEQNPYPRWVDTMQYYNPSSIKKLVNRMKLNVRTATNFFVNKPEILIAGCGTGQHALTTASRFANSNVLAIDLSLSSLSYAQRKTSELNVKNIKYMQADILDLENLGKKFDVIESVGVLHHMKDLMEGLLILKKCLKTGGLMKLGIYSEKGRASVIRGRELIEQLGLNDLKENMLEVRKVIFDSDDVVLKNVPNFMDFYSTSGLKDLLFHVQEHRFDLPDIKNFLKEVGLSFVGFELPNNYKLIRMFEEQYPHREAIYDLDCWNEFEIMYPDTFKSMYQFWAQNDD